MPWAVISHFVAIKLYFGNTLVGLIYSATQPQSLILVAVTEFMGKSAWSMIYSRGTRDPV